jgi:hypothetical protein
MNEEELQDFKNEELINIKLPRSQYDILKKMLREREAYTTLSTQVKNSWIWIVGSGVLAFMLLYDRFHPSWMK